jgi:hypothetical protein
MFWRWPRESQKWARDGLPIYLTQPPTPYRKPQPKERDQDVVAAVRAKFDKFRSKGYVAKGTVKGLTTFFTVPKGEGDVRLVFDGTKSGLNDVIWAPSFTLPSINTLLASLEPGTWMADIDVAEQFYNFLLDPAIRPFCGVDLSPYYPEVTSWEMWVRCVMGIKTSPEGCVRMDLLGDEINRGDHLSPLNPFHYDHLRLNLPGSETYQPSLPWVSKVNTTTGRLAGDVKTYVDDKRPTGRSYAHCKEVARRVASTLTYLGMQDASRKREPPSLRAGAWSGVVCHTDEGAVTVLCTQDKWEKASGYIRELQEVCNSTNTFEHKRLESIRGFLIYVIRTYPAFTPYLKGIHLTLDSWRPHRDHDGWKTLNAIRHHTTQPDFDITDHQPPNHVKGVPRLHDDLLALGQLFSTPHPPRRVIRSSSSVMIALYGFGDASGEGFGGTLQTSTGIRYRYGLWGRDVSHQSSNYREIRNLVDLVDLELRDNFVALSQLVTSVEALVLDGTAPSTELFLFTDNSVAEGAFFRGTSSNPKLFDLILRLRQLEIHRSLRLHVVHVAGQRMIAQGTDGLSRGNLDMGVMEGTPMLSFVPLHLGALDRSPSLLSWIRTWSTGFALCSLQPLDWHTVGHGVTGFYTNLDGVLMPECQLDSGVILVWSPPPTAADYALEELSLSRHKRPHIRHIFVCPRLFTHTWRKRLFKLADYVFYLPAGRRPPAWPDTCYEPLIVGVLLPFQDTPPWSLRGSPPLHQLDIDLRACWQASDDDTSLLGRLWHLSA